MRLSSLKYIAATVVSIGVTVEIGVVNGVAGQFHRAGTSRDELASISVETRSSDSKRDMAKERLLLICLASVSFIVSFIYSLS